MLAFLSRDGERLLAKDVDALGEQLHADRRVQAVGKRQDHGVDAPRHVAIVAQHDRAEAKATTQVLEPRRVHVTDGRQLYLGRRQHRRKMGPFRNGAAADDADAHGARPSCGRSTAVRGGRVAVSV